MDGFTQGVGGGANLVGIYLVIAQVNTFLSNYAGLFGHLAHAVAGGIVAVPGGYGAVGGAAQAVVPVPLHGREVGHGGDVAMRIVGIYIRGSFMAEQAVGGQIGYEMVHSIEDAPLLYQKRLIF